MLTTIDVPTAAARRIPNYLAGQVLLLGLLFGLGAYHVRAFLDDQRLPPLREQPLAIEPLYDDKAVVSDHQAKPSRTEYSISSPSGSATGTNL